MTTTRRSGFTLVELLVSLTLLAVLLGGVFGLVVTTQREFFRQRDVITGQDALRNAEIVIGTVLRAAGADPGITGLARLEPNPLAHAYFDNLRTVSDFNPVDRDFNDPLEDVLVYVASDTLYVRWQAGALAQPVAYPVRSVRFEYYDRTGAILTTVPAVLNATRVKLTLTTLRSSRDATLERRESWIYLRNRR
jgi:prepilin-type N-terminal cleavage/methylation domain-containing protein